MSWPMAAWCIFGARVFCPIVGWLGCQWVEHFALLYFHHLQSDALCRAVRTNISSYLPETSSLVYGFRYGYMCGRCIGCVSTFFGRIPSESRELFFLFFTTSCSFWSFASLNIFETLKKILLLATRRWWAENWSTSACGMRPVSALRSHSWSFSTCA